MMRDSRGTTLLETLVAMLILTIGLVALAQFIAYASANDLRSRIRIERMPDVSALEGVGTRDERTHRWPRRLVAQR